MTSLSRLLAVSTLALLPVAIHAQLAPASAAPQTSTQPNLRTDSKPNTSLTPATDSGPLPETLGADSTPLMDLGQDWSVQENENQPAQRTVLKMHKGATRVSYIETKPPRVRPVTNPPEPRSRMMGDLPEPRVRHMATPPDPLAVVPQPPPGV